MRQAKVWELVAAAMLGLAIAWLVSGCASMRTTCEYFEDGRLRSYSLRSTVVGTGETEVVTTDCAAIAYATEDTGLSDNGKAALGEISEGAVRAMIPTP